MGPTYPSLGAKLLAYLRLMKSKARDGHLGFSRQLMEMIALWLARGLGPGYYLFGEFWRREIPLRDKFRHLGPAAYKHEVGKVNSVYYQKLTQYKVAEKAIFSLFSIPSPKFLGHFHPSTGMRHTGELLRSGEDISDLLLSDRPDRICTKHVEGFGGAGFQAFSVTYKTSEPSLVSLADHTAWTPNELASELLALDSSEEGYLIEEYCSQHPWYHSINPSSLNTLRIYARVDPDNITHILGGYLRAGISGAIADNASQGGVFFLIDVDTGMLRQGRFNWVGTPEFAAHPDSGVMLEGHKLPFWDEILELIPRAMSIFPHTSFAGIDIAVTAQGPVLIEMNPEPDRTAACDIDIATLDMLGL